MTDISFYKYLEAAFRHKLFKDTKATSFNYLGFNLPYESMEGKKGIFEYARRVLPSFYSLHFPNTDEGHLQMARDFLQKLDRHQDPELPKYFDPNQAPVEYEPVIEEAKVESATPAAMPESPLPPPPAPKAPPARRIILPSSQEEEEGEKPTPAQPVATPPQETGAPPPSTAGVPQTPSTSFSTSVGQPLPERKDKEKKKRWFGRLRSSGLSNPLDLLSKRFANWVWRNALKPILNFAWRSILQPALRWLAGQAGRLLFQLLPRLALAALNSLLGLLGGISLGGITAGLAAALPWMLGAIAVVITVAVIFTAFQGFQEIQFPSEEPTPISSCQFVRGGSTPPAETYQSSFILDLFRNASKVTTVPPEVLAAIARVESPSVTSKTDTDFPHLNSVAGCPKSETGALGIMQIQPPDTTGYFKSGVEFGASFLGKTAVQLTEEDFCDVRKNIIIAGGFILKKLESRLKIGDVTKWDPAWNNDPNVINELAEGYYGCLNYGDPANPNKCVGPYNYGDDLWTSIQSCKTKPAPGIIEPPSDDFDALHNNILTRYDINFDKKFPMEYLTWAWEKLEEIAKGDASRFLQLVNPNQTTLSITRNDQLINEQIGCSNITMRGASRSTGQSYPEQLFKVVFIHELSHIIESCRPDDISKKAKFAEIVPSQEDYLTNYSANADACAGLLVSKLNEDYAETIAYFLNENYPEQSLGIGQACEPTQFKSKNPIYSGKKPLHRNFAIDLLLR